MKTEPELKSLAEYAAEFFGAEVQQVIWNTYKSKMIMVLVIDTQSLFYNEMSSPILAHLALKEMIKRGCDWSEQRYFQGKYESVFRFKGQLTGTSGDKDENQFIALWSAIEQTGEK